jgi:predicted GIY-YIG superfamily endonuclease
MPKLFNVYFLGCTDIERNYEGTTDNFKLWLKKHNEGRAEEDQEFEDDFELEEVHLVLFEGGNE